MKYLLSTVSYPVMNLSINVHKAILREANEKHREFMDKLRQNRYEAIIAGKPYQQMFS